MRFHVLVHLKPDVLDAQGQAIEQAIHSAGYESVHSLRVGKSFYLDVDADNPADARDEIERLCAETLCNPLIETFTYEAAPA